VTLLADWLRRVFGGSPADPPRLPGPALGREAIEQRLQQSKVPGAALARITAGEVAWVAGYGTCRTSPFSAHVTGDTIFQAASVSKPVTALAVLRLVHEGRLDLDADVRPMLDHPIPDHPIMAGQPDAGRPITARLLLQHRSGIAGRGTTPTSDGTVFLPGDRGGGSRRFRQRRGLRMPTTADSWSAVVRTYPTGTAFSYSGAGYLVLQHLIEQVAGVGYSEYLAKLLPQFGARFATFDLHPPEARTLARGHGPDGRELPGGYELVPWSAAGGLFITGAGLAEVVAAMSRRGDAVIADELMEEMFARNLGLFGRTEDGHRVLRHGGDNGGYRASITLVPDRRDGAVVLTNGRATDGPTLRRELADLVMATSA
jgi:CubicO group peptidase (beta-lactamase class C family)